MKVVATVLIVLNVAMLIGTHSSRSVCVSVTTLASSAVKFKSEPLAIFMGWFIRYKQGAIRLLRHFVENASFKILTTFADHHS